MDKRVPRVIVLGGGPAGCGAAYQLRRTGKADVVLLERQDVVGGNAASFQWGGQWLDYGSHRLHHTVDSRILADIKAMLGADFGDFDRHGRIRIRNRWVHFPIQTVDLLKRLDKRFAFGLLRDVIARKLAPRDPGDSFASVLLANLGPTMSHHFYFPYARKMWGYEPEALSGIQARKRVSAGSFGKLLRRLLKPVGGGRYYYMREGYGQISRAYAREASALGADVKLGWNVTRIERAGGPGGPWRVTAERNGEQCTIEGDYLWSTIPITVLARMMAPPPPREVLTASGQIDYRAMVLVYVKLPVQQYTTTDAHYFPEENVLLTRLSEPKNYFRLTEPRGTTILCAEYPCRVDDELWSASDEALAKRLADDVATAGIPLPAAPTDVLVRRLRQAYPVYLKGYEVPLGVLDGWVASTPDSARLRTAGAVRARQYPPRALHGLRCRGLPAGIVRPREMGGVSQGVRDSRRRGLIVPPEPLSPRAWRWSLAGLVLVAAVARAIGLNSGMWIDEIYSLVRSFRQPLGTIVTEYWGDNHHPLYALLAHLSRAAFGEAPWSIRLPAAFFGVITVPCTAMLARRVVPDRQALLAALLLAVSYHHVWFSQNARGYSAIACFTVVGMWAILRAMDDGRRQAWAAYAVVAALGAYTHLTMVFVVVGHALGVGIELLRRARRGVAVQRQLTAAVVAFAGAAALTVLFYAAMLPGVIAFFRETHSNLEGVSTPAWAAAETLRMLALGVSGGVAIVGAVVAAGGLAVAALGCGSLWRRSPLFLFLLAAPIAATLAGAALARGTLYPRFFFFIVGPALIVAVHGVFALVQWVCTRLRVPHLGVPLATGCCAVVVVLSAATLPLNYRYPKQDYAGAMQYVNAIKAPGDLIVSAGVPADPYRTLYGQSWPNISSLEDLERLRTGRRVWVVSTFSRYIAAKTPSLARVLDQECAEPRTFRGTVSGGDIHVCVLEPR